MKLKQVFAFQVVPQKHVPVAARTPPSGGLVKMTEGLRGLVSSAFLQIRGRQLTTVEFTGLDNPGRKHPVRDDLMIIAFGSTTSPRAAAGRMAARLSGESDLRSKTSLLLVTVEVDEEDAGQRRVTLLVLPREDVVQLGSDASDEVLLQLVTDAFSTVSELRKLVRSEGRNGNGHFMRAQILDLQLSDADRSVADFWINDFLQAREGVDSESGSRQLAGALRRTYDASNEDEKETLIAAIQKARSGVVRRTTIEHYAENEIPEHLHDRFFSHVPEHMRTATFEVNTSVLKNNLALHVMVLDNGITVTVPANEVTKGFEVENRPDGRIVSIRGRVRKERLKRSVKSIRAPFAKNAKADGRKNKAKPKKRKPKPPSKDPS